MTCFHGGGTDSGQTGRLRGFSRFRETLGFINANPPLVFTAGVLFIVDCFRENWFFTRFGGDLLSHVLRRSTIGATALNCRVRKGTGCFARAIATKPSKEPVQVSMRFFQRVLIERSNRFYCVYLLIVEGLASTGSNQANRAISTGQLNALLHLHLRPIDVVVFHGPQGIPSFEGGFPLRCLQRLSCPDIATQHYRWHDNWSTSGPFTPVLSY